MAVQGGKCISHGAQKKKCNLDGCAKQAIMGGMCKKHYDSVNGVVKVRASRRRSLKQKSASMECFSPIAVPLTDEHPKRESGHQRGLSFFQEIDNMDTIISDGMNDPRASSGASPVPVQFTISVALNNGNNVTEV